MGNIVYIWRVKGKNVLSNISNIFEDSIFELWNYT
jgi:hypothetical protein